MSEFGLVPLEDRRSVARHVAMGRLRSVGWNLARTILSAVSVAAITLLLWVAWVAWVDNDFIAKGPADVWAYLVGDEDAGENRAEVLDLLGRTLIDSGIGFTAGMAAAIVLAGLIVLSKGIEAAVMPVAMILRAVPLIAMAPVIILIFGRGFSSVAVISGIVVLFPALVTIVFGLRAVSPQMRDVVHVYGGSDWDALRRVAFPSALPSLFAAIRISVPGAITGALIAEWLATGQGIGYGVVSAAGRSQNTKVWALVVVITVVSLVLYTVAQIVESFVLSRFGKEAGRA
ncbi:ABC transporter permease [Aeromicrobium alkaliterrae]|uniref:ABC transporter permease n=1 Tax=Aeromicrobium alkaliterrae TaxID=302168 RepID=A0ABN2JX72_9ACTN